MSPVVANTLLTLEILAVIFVFARGIARVMDGVTTRERAECPHCQRMAG